MYENLFMFNFYDMKNKKEVLIEIIERIQSKSQFANNILILLKSKYCTEDLVNSLLKIIIKEKNNLSQNDKSTDFGKTMEMFGGIGEK